MNNGKGISFPETPTRPATENAELTYRLGFLRISAENMVCMTEDSPATPAWKRAVNWTHEWILKGARASIDELGPLSSAAQRIAIQEFLSSLTPKPADKPRHETPIHSATNPDS